MARIIHVEDEPAWIDFTRDALADHRVDSASSYAEALELIQGNAPYDIALVDLSLGRDDDRLGGEILDLLRGEYPSTRRIVVTGRPPVGGMRDNLFDRYGVEDVIIKGTTTLPGLRKSIAKALARDYAAEAKQNETVRKSELAEHYRDWRAGLESTIQTRVTDAEHALHNAGRMRGQSAERASNDLRRWRALQESLSRECSELEAVLSGVKGSKGADSARDQLNRTAARFAAEISQLESGAQE